MEKKNQNNEELQSRREFFKRAAKKALPILGAIVLASAPGIVKAAEEETPNGCSWGCTGMCRDNCYNNCYADCTRTCSGGCENSCTGSCNNTCRYTCRNTCDGSCSGGCARSAYA